MSEDAAVNISGISETAPNQAAATALLDATERVRGSLGQLLTGLRVGISISDSPELAALGFSKAHQQDAMVEFARFLLANGASLAYGGDLREGGYTRLFFDLASHYSTNHGENPLVHNYLSWPLHLNLTAALQAEFNKMVVFHRIEPAAELEGLGLDAQQHVWPTTVPHRYAWARSLTKMREVMEAATDARILIGGPELIYAGALPGLLEEALLSLALNKPTYLIGAFGGVTQGIIEGLQATDSHRFADLPSRQDSLSQEFLEYYNHRHPEKPLDFSAIQTFLSSYSLERLSGNNGLSIAENQRLFVTPHLMEMVYLVLTGLTRLKYKKPDVE